MKMDLVGSIYRQALRPHQSVCGLSHPAYSQRTEAGEGCLWVSPRRVIRTFPLPVSPFLIKAYWFVPRRLLGGLSSFLSPSRSPRVGGWIRTAKSCILLIRLLLLLASSIVLIVTDPEGLLYQGWRWGLESSVQFSSVAQSCLTLCDPMNRSTPGLPVHHQPLEFTQTHIHRVSDAIQPSHPLSSPSPPAPNPSQHQGLFQWVNSSHEVAKALEFQL